MTLAPTQSYFSGAKSLNNIGPDVWWYPLLLSCFSGLEISNAKKKQLFEYAKVLKHQTWHKQVSHKPMFFSAIWESHHHQHTSTYHIQSEPPELSCRKGQTYLLHITVQHLIDQLLEQKFFGVSTVIPSPTWDGYEGLWSWETVHFWRLVTIVDVCF